MEQKGIEVHGQRLKYRLGGKGPLVLLIHGMAGSATTWKQVMPELSERFTVLAPDLSGHGESDKTKDARSFRHSAHRVHRIDSAGSHQGVPETNSSAAPCGWCQIGLE